ncbi:hypothetical protein Tco_1285809 [Tanacetum coccineum]
MSCAQLIEADLNLFSEILVLLLADPNKMSIEDLRTELSNDAWTHSVQAQPNPDKAGTKGEVAQPIKVPNGKQFLHGAVDPTTTSFSKVTEASLLTKQNKALETLKKSMEWIFLTFSIPNGRDRLKLEPGSLGFQLHQTRVKECPDGDITLQMRCNDLEQMDLKQQIGESLLVADELYQHYGITHGGLAEIGTIFLASTQTQLESRHISDASDFPFKEDYTIVFKPRAVIYKDRDDNRKMMRIDEVHKFSDGTLTRIKEKLDFMVKDFKLFS